MPHMQKKFFSNKYSSAHKKQSQDNFKKCQKEEDSQTANINSTDTDHTNIIKEEEKRKKINIVRNQSITM